MKLHRKIICTISILFVLFSCYKSYGANVFNINFDINKCNYDNNFNSIYKEVEINNIAPGTNGKIIIKIGNSEKNIKYFLRFLKEENKPYNMKFSFENKEYKSLLELNDHLSGGLEKNEEKYITIIYDWNYETGSSKNEIEKNDEMDTLDNNKIYKFKVELVLQNDDIEQFNNPKTGDNIFIFVILFICSAIFLVYIIFTVIKNYLTDVL